VLSINNFILFQKQLQQQYGGNIPAVSLKGHLLACVCLEAVGTKWLLYGHQ
jgi:hypothetical protein